MNRTCTFQTGDTLDNTTTVPLNNLIWACNIRIILLCTKIPFCFKLNEFEKKKKNFCVKNIKFYTELSLLGIHLLAVQTQSKDLKKKNEKKAKKSNKLTSENKVGPCGRGKGCQKKKFWNKSIIKNTWGVSLGLNQRYERAYKMKHNTNNGNICLKKLSAHHKV